MLQMCEENAASVEASQSGSYRFGTTAGRIPTEQPSDASLARAAMTRLIVLLVRAHEW
jgi:hypothetical protein